MRGGKTFLFYLSDILIKPLIKEDEGPGESSNRKYEKGNLFPTFSHSFLSLFFAFPLLFFLHICNMHSPQAPGGVRATGEDLVPEPSDKVEEAGERGGAAQDGGQQQLDQQQ